MLVTTGISQPWKFSLCSIALGLATAVAARASLPTDSAARAKLIGQPTALQAQPATVTLDGPRAVQQLIVSGRYADGSLRDLTPFFEFSLDGTIAAMTEGG